MSDYNDESMDIINIPDDIKPLLKRVSIFLEDGEWEKADLYCERVLDNSPECAEAYLGKLMAELKVKHREDLKNCVQPFDNNNNYEKVFRFGDEALKENLREIILHIKKRNESIRLENFYNRAVSLMNSAVTPEDFKNAVELFGSIAQYKDSASLARICEEKSKSAEKNRLLENARMAMNRCNIEGYNEALGILKLIPGWKDADMLVESCHKGLNEQQEAKEKRDEEKKKKVKKIKKTIFAILVLVCLAALIVSGALFAYNVVIPEVMYNKAVELMEKGQYQKAISTFENLEDNVNSNSMITECKYRYALELMDDGKYDEAVVQLETIERYKDSEEKMAEANYGYAIMLLEGSEFEKAYDIFSELYDYKDSREKAIIAVNYVDLKNCRNGDYVVFGSYEQDDNLSNGKEEITWIVLERKGNKALLISENALENKVYNEEAVDTTWEKCTLRNWLNKEFFNDAFTKKEQSWILKTTVSAHENSSLVDQGNDTEDKVFLLSVAEAWHYFDSPEDRACSNGNWWWLRSIGEKQSFAAHVGATGKIYESGFLVTNNICDVRPAIWVNLDF